MIITIQINETIIREDRVQMKEGWTHHRNFSGDEVLHGLGRPLSPADRILVTVKWEDNDRE